MNITLSHQTALTVMLSLQDFKVMLLRIIASGAAGISDWVLMSLQRPEPFSFLEAEKNLPSEEAPSYSHKILY